MTPKRKEFLEGFPIERHVRIFRDLFSCWVGAAVLQLGAAVLQLPASAPRGASNEWTRAIMLSEGDFDDIGLAGMKHPLIKEELNSSDEDSSDDDDDFNAPVVDIDAIASAKSLGDAMRILAPQLEGLPRKSRGKYGKRKHLSAEEKAELTRRRNRENARSTRKRRKMYIKHLQKVAETLKTRQDALARMTSPKAEMDIQAERREIVRRFFELRSSGVVDVAQWNELIDGSFRFTLPVTTLPCRSSSVHPPLPDRRAWERGGGGDGTTAATDNSSETARSWGRLMRTVSAVRPPWRPARR